MSISEAVPGTASDTRRIDAELGALARRLAALAAGTGLDAAGHDGDIAVIEAMLADLIRLYSVALAREGRDHRAVIGPVTATEAVTAISALMQAQALNTFDLALWQSSLRRG